MQPDAGAFPLVAYAGHHVTPKSCREYAGEIRLWRLTDEFNDHDASKQSIYVMELGVIAATNIEILQSFRPFLDRFVHVCDVTHEASPALGWRFKASESSGSILVTMSLHK